MSNHILTPEQVHALVQDIERAPTDAVRIQLMIVWIQAVTDDIYPLPIQPPNEP